MKVIDLLNKIANGEKIEARHELFSLEYYNLKEFRIAYDKSVSDFTLGDLIRILNDEVEVIEDTPKEDKKIRKFKIEYSPDIEEHIFYIDGNKPIHHTLDGKTELLIVKINEIIDRLNGDSDE